MFRGDQNKFCQIYVNKSPEEISQIDEFINLKNFFKHGGFGWITIYTLEALFRCF